MLKYRIAIMFFLSTLSFEVGVLTQYKNIPFSVSVTLIGLSVFIPMGYAIYEIVQSEKHSRNIGSSLYNQNSELQFIKAKQEWDDVKKSHQMHQRGIEGKEIYVKILKKYLSSDQILRYKADGKLEKILKSPLGKIVYLEVEEIDLI